VNGHNRQFARPWLPAGVVALVALHAYVAYRVSTHAALGMAALLIAVALGVKLFVALRAYALMRLRSGRKPDAG
jgi:hypothetical protein